jgi:superfamily II DNA or RNA helicase
MARRAAASPSIVASLFPAQTEALGDESFPGDHAIRAARQEQLELREQAARQELPEIIEAPEGRYGRYGVASGKSGALYEVLWLDADFSWCSCPDVRKSELPLCKHQLAVRLRRAKSRGSTRPVAQSWAVRQARDTTGRVHHPLGDLRLYLRKPASPRLRKLLDAEGFIDPDALGARSAAWLHRVLEAEPGLKLRPEAWALLEAEARKAQAQKAHDAFDAALGKHLAGKGPAPEAWAQLQRDLKVKLHPYQVEGVRFLQRVPKALLGDDMGLGKTFQTLSALHLLRLRGEVGRAVVICPASLKQQWVREARKFLGDALPIVAVEGGKTARARLFAEHPEGVLVLNYETVIRDLVALARWKPDLVVLDEAQRIKNWDTKTSKSIKLLTPKRAIVLTGTPMENRLTELHSVAEFLDERVLGPMWRVPPEFAVTTTVDDRERVVGYRHLDLIRRRLAPLWLRRERRTVLGQLPPRMDQTVPVPFSDEQERIHQGHAQTASLLAAKKYLTPGEQIILMAELTNMRMAASGLLLYRWKSVEARVRAGKIAAQLMQDHPSPKLDEFCQVLESLLGQPGTKVVVFSQWERMLRLAGAAARPVLRAAKTKAVYFHGGLTSVERAEVIRQLHEDDAVRVLFSTDAGATGLNLQEAASAMVHLEVPWNPAVFEQRVGRIHRMGQTRPIQVISLVTERSIEERIAQVSGQKRALFDGLFKDGSDEVNFDANAAGNLVERMKQLLGDSGTDVPPLPPIAEEPAAPAAPPVEPTMEVRVLDPLALAPAAPAAAPAVDAALLDSPTAAPTSAPSAPEPGLQVDLGAVAQGLLGLLGVATPGPLQAMPVTVRRREGRIQVDLPDIPAPAWAHLQQFIQAMTGAAAPAAAVAVPIAPTEGPK